MSETLATERLIEQAQEGDQAALNELCDRYWTRVLAVVRIRLGPRLRGKVESGDIVQSVMMDAFKKVHSFSFRTEGAFLKYLNKVVENRIRDQADHWAAQRRDPNREIPLIQRSPEAQIPLDLPEGDARTPSDVITLREQLDHLERAMDILGEQSPEYRDLIVATKLEGQSYTEIADEAGKSPDAVRMQAKRAMLALTRIYRELDAGGSLP